MKKLDKFTEALANLNSEREVEQFCSELFSPKELSDFSLRWQLLKELHRGDPQRAIAERHGISLCKITRGSKILKSKDSIILKMLNKGSKI
ncbi:MAG: transcriptional regulator [Deltaproteobacteria bacterium]|nr:MAG: transcriptional regulator [Deltaproteobacteria bacterium]